MSDVTHPRTPIVENPVTVVDDSRSLMSTNVHDALGEFAGAAAAPEQSRPAGKRSLTLSGLLRYRWMMLGVFVAVAGLGVAGVWLLIAPEYEATAIIEVAPVMPRLLDKTEDTGLIPLYQQHLASQQKIISSPEVLNRVLDREEVRRTNWYHGRPQTPLDKFAKQLPPRDRLREQLTVESPRHTQLIYVSLNARTPGEARLIVDAIVAEYLRYIKTVRFEGDDQLLQALDAMQRDHRFQITLLTDEIAKLQKQLQTSSPEELVAQQRLTLDGLEGRLRTLDLDLRLAKQALAEAESDDANEEDAGPSYELDPEWRRLSEARAEAEHQLAVKARNFGAAHPEVQRAQQRVNHADEQLERREQQLRRQASLGILPADMLGDAAAVNDPKMLNSQIRQLEQRREILLEEIRSTRQEFESVFDATQALAQKTEDLAGAREELQIVTDRVSELEQKRKTPASIRRIGQASEPTYATEDKRLKFSLAAIFGAIAAAVGLGILRLSFSPDVQEVGEVTAAAPQVMLGYLPIFRGRRSTIEDCPINAECVRTIRTTLLHRLDEYAGQIVHLSSAGAGTGKTTLSVMLGRSLAQAGRRVLLIDGDIRKPSLTRRLDIESATGLLQLLRGEQAAGDAIHTTSIPGLHVLPTGALSGVHDVELLANGRLPQLLARWRDQYDIILVDSGPLLPIADAAIIAKHVDGTVVLVRERHCRQSEVFEALALLSASGGRLLGTVFVGSGRGRRYDASYYGYGMDYTN